MVPTRWWVTPSSNRSLNCCTVVRTACRHRCMRCHSQPLALTPAHWTPANQNNGNDASVRILGECDDLVDPRDRQNRIAGRVGLDTAVGCCLHLVSELHLSATYRTCPNVKEHGTQRRRANVERGYQRGLCPICGQFGIQVPSPASLFLKQAANCLGQMVRVVHECQDEMRRVPLKTGDTRVVLANQPQPVHAQSEHEAHERVTDDAMCHQRDGLVWVILGERASREASRALAPE